MLIAENLDKLRASVPAHVGIVAVSKTQPVAGILEAYKAGQRDFGENRVQELASKCLALPGDIRWHYLGHLQTNKVRILVPLVSLIHSIDSLRLLEVVNMEASKIGRVVDCLLQFHIATEESKFGLDWQEAYSLLGSEEYGRMNHIRITGVMGMASFTEDQALVRQEFSNLATYFERLRTGLFNGISHFTILSMGMSGDYHIAIGKGSNMIRIGTAIFGDRR